MDHDSEGEESVCFTSNSCCGCYYNWWRMLLVTGLVMFEGVLLVWTFNTVVELNQ